MKIRHVAALLILGATTTFVQAAPWHIENTEIGYVTHTGESAPGKSADEVHQELLAAKSDKREWYFKNLTIAKPAWTQKSTKTRAQVIQEMEDMSPEEKAWLKEVYTPGS